MRKIFAALGLLGILLPAICSAQTFLGNFPAGSTVYVPIATYNAAGASVTITNLAVTDVEIYKNGSTTQRSSDNGVALLDTDGIDFDAQTGLHGVSIDLSDNTDAGFYAAGSQYWVWISPFTADSQTVGTVYTFTIDKGGSVSGIGTGGIVAGSFAAGAIDASAIAADAIGASEIATDAIGAAELAANAIGAAEIADAAIDEATFATTAGTFYPLEIVDQGTAQSATATTLVLRAAAAFADDELIGARLLITGGSAGVGQTRTITDYVGATDTATVANWTSTPSGTITYKILSDPPGAGGSVSIAAGGITASSFAAGAIDATAIATDAIGAAEIAADAIGASELAANAITSSEIASNALTDAKFDTSAGTFYSQGVIDQGTAQGASATTLQLRSAAAFADSEIVGATVLITGGSTGVGQSRIITAYTSSSDTATVADWTTTPSGTITYKVFGTAPGSSGTVSIAAGGISASSFASGAIDANAIAASAIGNSELADGAISSGKFATGAIDATAIAADAIGASEIAADAIGASELAADAIGSSELAANAIGAAEVADGTIDAATFASGAIDATAIAADAIGASELAADAIGASEIATDAVGSAELAATAAVEISTQVLSDQLVIAGTCDSGSATTCVDDALTQAADSILSERLICFNDGFCSLANFTAASDTMTTTKTAPSTRAAKTYTIFPSTQQ